MRFLVILLFLFCNTVFSSEITTQYDLNIQESNQLKLDNNKMNKIYNKLLVKYKNSEVFTNNLKDSQAKWESYVKSQMKVKYSDDETRKYKSVYPMCNCAEMNEMILYRIKVLKDLLEPIEGDVCS